MGLALSGEKPLYILEDLNQRMSQADVSYRCGSCGYALNLRSSNRITSETSSGYAKSIKKGYISFGSIDISRFTQVDKMSCIPISCGSSETKFLCRGCGKPIGYGKRDRNVVVKIGVVQPSEQ